MTSMSGKTEYAVTADGCILNAAGAIIGHAGNESDGWDIAAELNFVAAERDELKDKLAEAIEALKLMADQYLEAQIDGKEVYDHRFMAAGEACPDALISAGMISEAHDYRGAGQSHNKVAELRPSGKGTNE